MKTFVMIYHPVYELSISMDNLLVHPRVEGSPLPNEAMRCTVFSTPFRPGRNCVLLSVMSRQLHVESVKSVRLESIFSLSLNGWTVCLPMRHIMTEAIW